MKMKIYLAGFIQGSKIEKCTAWRIKIREHYEQWINKKTKKIEPYPIIWLDPLNGKEFATISLDGLKSNISAHAIVHRDYKCVAEADMIVVNMDTFGEKRPLTGTICELAWAWSFHKPIIMITNEMKYKEHPFLNYFASWIVPDVDTLLKKKIINYFYKGIVSAEYHEEEVKK